MHPRLTNPSGLLRFLPLALAAILLIALVAQAGPALAQDAAPVAEAAAAVASEPAEASFESWGGFFGRTHVLVLHLPIGLLIGAFTIEVLGFFRRSKGYDVAAAWLFVLGFASSAIAVFTGLLLGTEEAAASNEAGKDLNMFTLLFADADKGVSETLGLHMWLGVSLMVIAGVAAVLKIMSVRKQWHDHESSYPAPGGWPLGLARVSLIAIMVGMPLVGHLGGNLVHGRAYLTERAPNDTIKSLITAMHLVGEEDAGTKTIAVGPDGGEIEVKIGTVAYWDAIIQPALDDHCIACHNVDKQNGKLRLDTLEWAMKGGSSGGSIEPGDAEFSEIYRRVALPPSHDEFMPTNTKKYGMMSQEEVFALGDWLQEFNGKLEDGSTVKANPKQPAKDPEPKPVAPIIDRAGVNAIAKAGGNAQSLSLAEPQLSVKFAYLKTLSPDAVATLQSNASEIAAITFEGSALDDAALSELPEMPKLIKLNLKDTKITDAGLAALPKLENLEWLNLFGTGITDAGLESLTRYPNLKKLYITGTGATAEGVEKLRAALKDAGFETEVFSDHDGAFTFPAPEPEAKPEETKKPEPEPVAAKAINTACPVSGAPVKAGFVSTFEGKSVGFCCNNCKGKFDADPKKFAGKLP